MTDFLFGFISGVMIAFALMDYFSYRRLKHATLAIRETTARMRENR